ncbi:hypothetical protein TrST_g11312 [Triparma strigata]|uniref:Acyl-[acyl-carrier-protein] desaturase n=1 Tax=Triparma strigata TaxID=1606541 RepID=A0A9W7AE50_9STRA|nr:hypothetical protein TrST_g11312 [Triparma strigata]
MLFYTMANLFTLTLFISSCSSFRLPSPSRLTLTLHTLTPTSHEETLNHHSIVVNSFPEIVQKAVDDILLVTGEDSWQPSDLLSYPPKEGWKESNEGLSDELLVVLIGDMITEEALPTYQTLLNTFAGCSDPTGSSPTPWSQWSRGWTSEENRHGDLLNRFLFMNPERIDMRSVECTVQHLITSGFDPGADRDPYKGFIYTSFQERATKISHGNVGKLAKKVGAENLSRICAYIAGDEARHEIAYQGFCTEILERDPEGFIVSMGEVMRKGITMPAEMMQDGHNKNLYQEFSSVAQDLGVYTAFDYADIAAHLVRIWNLEKLTGLKGEADKEREFICKLPDRYRKLAERAEKKKEKGRTNVGPKDAKVMEKTFKWIKKRS